MNHYVNNPLYSIKIALPPGLFQTSIIIGFSLEVTVRVPGKELFFLKTTPPDVEKVIVLATPSAAISNLTLAYPLVGNPVKLIVESPLRLKY